MKELYTTAGMVYANGNPAELYLYDTYGEVTIDPGLYFDSDGSGVVDLTDFGPFQLCFTGSGGGPVDIDCTMMDFDGDGNVDLVDFGNFQTCLASGGSSSAMAGGGGAFSSLTVGGFSSLTTGFVTLIDPAAFDACYTGPDLGPADAECSQYDADADNDVDLFDYCTLTGCFSLLTPPAIASATADGDAVIPTTPPGTTGEEEPLFGDATPTGETTIQATTGQAQTEGGINCKRPRQPTSPITNPY